MKIAVCFCILASLTACATARDSVLLGAAVGGTVGTALGSVMSRPNKDQTKSAALGAATGVALGGLAGYLEHKKPGNGNSQSLFGMKSSGNTPAVSVPEVRRMWVPDRIESEQYIEGHFIYVIDKPSRWRTNELDSKRGE